MCAMTVPSTISASTFQLPKEFLYKRFSHCYIHIYMVLIYVYYSLSLARLILSAGIQHAQEIEVTRKKK